MIRHIIIWKLKETDTPEEKERIKDGIRSALEGLNGKIPGMVSLRVRTEKLPSSTGDVMLDSLFKDGNALAGYSIHPLHVAAADGFVRPYTAVRTSFDYAVKEEELPDEHV